ncbi:hypothetical protein [Hydrococcus rivularis]|nr:hypothetical protein [Hydrococcus rivularis]
MAIQGAIETTWSRWANSIAIGIRRLSGETTTVSEGVRSRNAW